MICLLTFLSQVEKDITEYLLTENFANGFLSMRGLREREKDQLLLIEEKSSQLGTSVKNAPCKLTIELGAKKIQQDGFNWRIGHKNFASNFKLKQITLLVENGKYDGQIYKHIFELVADKNKVGMGQF